MSADSRGNAEKSCACPAFSASEPRTPRCREEAVIFEDENTFIILLSVLSDNCTQHQQRLEVISVYLRSRKTVSAADTYFQFTHLRPCHPAYHLAGAKAIADAIKLW